MSRFPVRRAATMAAGLLAVLAVGPLSPSPARADLWAIPVPNTSADTASDLDEFEVQVMDAINAVRVAAGLSRIRNFDTCVDRMAETWSNRIVSTGLLEHRNQRQVLRNCQQTWAGENLVRGEGLTPLTAVNAWMASPPHREVLLKKRASRAGVAITRDPTGSYIGVLNVTDSG